MSSPSPYAPPMADLLRKAPPPGGPARPPRTTIDIAEALRYPFQDPAWLSKAAVAGLMMFVPFVGPFLLLGWKVEVYERARRGETELPGISFGSQLVAGFKVFLGLFSSIFLLVFAMVALHAAILGVGWGVGYLLQTLTGSAEAMSLGIGVASLFMTFLHIFLAFGVNGLMPELYRRAFMGETLGLINPMPSLSRVKGRAGVYLIVVVGMIAANLAGAMGVFACYLGLFVTLPLGYAASAHLIAQWTELSGGD